MPCEIKVLIEIYGPIDTGVIWITNIIGKIDCIPFYLPSFDPRFDHHQAFFHFFQEIFILTLYSMYFVFAFDPRFDHHQAFFHFFQEIFILTLYSMYCFCSHI